MCPLPTRRAKPWRWLPLLLVSACTLGGSAVLEPVDAETWEAGASDGVLPVGACVTLVPRELRVVPPAGVRVQLDAAGCEGLALPPLVASSLRVFEDDQPVDPAESGLVVRAMKPSLRVSLLVLVDLSGSVAAGNGLEAVRAATLNLLTALAGNIAADTGPWLEVGVQAFATRSEPLREVLPFTACPQALAALQPTGALEAWRPVDDATDLYGSVVDAVEVLRARGAGATPDARGLLVIVSDGRDTIDTTESPLATAAIMQVDATWALSAGDAAEVDVLRRLVTGGTVSALDTWDRVAADVRQRVLAWRDENAARFLLGYCSPRGAGQHRITVQAFDGDQPLQVVMPPLRFDAAGFTGGCDADPVANPCQWGTTTERVCGLVDGVACGTCGTVDRCTVCSDEGACVSP